MKKLISVIVSLVITGIVFAQEWTQVDNPDPNSNSLYSVCFTATDSGYAVGSNGTYLRWYGTDWQMQPYPANRDEDQKKILFTNANTGYICGEEKNILKTVDGGDNWTALMHDINGPTLYDIDFWDENNGVAVGADGTILKTTDGGDSWNEQNSGTSEDLLTVKFVSANVVLAGGRNGVMLRSADTGTTWDVITVNTTDHIREIGVANESTVYAATMGSQNMLKSTDTGLAWSQIQVVHSNGAAGLEVVSVTEIYLFANTTLYHGGDGGASWETIETGLSSAINDLWISPQDSSAWVVGTNGLIAYNPEIELSIELVDNQIPNQFQLSQNYPNPFNPITTIEYSLPVSGMVTVTIFNLLGQEITQLVNQWHDIGTFRITWNASDLPSGTYFYRIQTTQFTQTRKMVLMK